jgi:hypothetical protein
MTDLCAGCLKPLVTLPHGGRLRCCGAGYWSRRAPEPRDAWWPVTRRGGWFLYEKRERT